LEETKRLLPALFVIPEVIPELTQEEEKIYTGVAKEWIADILGMDFSPSNLHSELMDGSVLCRVMNTLKPGCIKKYYPNTKIKLLRQENIGFFITACESEFGLSPIQIFTANDLIDGNMKKSTRCSHRNYETFKSCSTLKPTTPLRILSSSF